MGDKDKHRATDLIKDLVHRLLSLNPNFNSFDKNPDGSSTEFDNTLRYAFRILSSTLTPSIEPDATAIADSIKRRLAASGMSSEAFTFAELYNKLCSKTGPGSITNKWAILYVLKIISDDAKSEKSGFGSSYLLPNLSSNTRDFTWNSENTHSQRSEERAWDSGVLLVKNDPQNLHEIAFKEFISFVKEESEVPEDVLVRDVLYACQGIDGKYVKFDEKSDGYALADAIKIPRATRTMVRKLCELGWLFKKVKGYISDCMEKLPSEDIGTVGQAFCAALHDELSEYYKLIAVLGAQAVNPIPLISETANTGNYLSLRRLSVWFVEPMVKMRLMAILVDNCRALRGGAMAGTIHLHAQHGDPLVREFMRNLLKRVCSPLFEMVRRWVVEGELEDVFHEFFVVAQPVKAESLWREGYKLHKAMLPSFISQSLAQLVLRTGKSINFLRVCCNDHGWVDTASSSSIGAGKGSFGYGETDALEALVVEAAKRVDKHLLNVIYTKFKFLDHCLAIKRYLLLGQGDFVQYLMDIVGPELSEPANAISTFKLAGLLETAIRSSNAQFHDIEILDRLRVKMMPHEKGDRGWDVFSLEYDARVPLDTVFTNSVMLEYLKIFNFLWRLRRVEHALVCCWRTMKPNSLTSHSFLKMEHSVKLRLNSILRRYRVLWVEMNHLVSNLQYYIMFEVLEVSWSNFMSDIEAAKDFDQVLAAHDKCLLAIVEKSLLGKRSKSLNKSLLVLFDVILCFRSHTDRLYEGIHELHAKSKSIPSTLQSHGRGKLLRQTRSKASNPKSSKITETQKTLAQQAREFFILMGKELEAISQQYSTLFQGFLTQLPVQQHVDLKFLFFRLDFTEFYSKLNTKS